MDGDHGFSNLTIIETFNIIKAGIYNLEKKTNEEQSKEKERENTERENEFAKRYLLPFNIIMINN